MNIAWIILSAPYFCGTSALVIDESEGTHSLWKFIAFVASRSGIYLILVTIILINFVSTVLKKKVENYKINKAAEQLKKNTLNVRQFQSPMGFFENTISASEEDTESIRNRLKEAEATVVALKSELEETLKAKASFANSIEELERDRTYSEDELTKIKISSSVEMDKLIKENSALKSQLERAKNEIQELTKVVEVLQREARITEAALQDQQTMSQHLETTKKELERLKSEMKGTKIERDTAVRLASEQIYKMNSDRSTHRRELIEEMIDVELRKMREEEEAATEHEITDRSVEPTISFNIGTEHDGRQRTYATSSRIIVDIGSQGHQPVFNSCFAPQVHRNALGDGPMQFNCPADDTYNMATENSVYSNRERTENSSEEEDIEPSDEIESDSEIAHARLVSSSPAFRAFLQNAFGC